MSLENVRYDAFISYRHCELDSFISENLHKKLENYKLPRSVVNKIGTGKTAIERVFRDEAELPLSSNLSDPISEALDNSEFLIVICTPRLPESQWCKKEIETFVKTHDRQHVLLVLAEGEPEESFPDILMHEEITAKDENGNDISVIVDREPLAADCRGEDNRQRLKALDNVVLKLCAAIFGLNYDDLKQRHRERQIKRRLIAMSAALAIVTVFAVTCLSFMLKINRQNKVISDKYAGAMASASEALLSQGLREDAIYSVRNVLPDKGSDGYNPEAYKALVKAIAPYEIENKYFPSEYFKIPNDERFFAISDDKSYALINCQGYFTVTDIRNDSEICRIDSENSDYAVFDGTDVVYINDDLEVIHLDPRSGKETVLADEGYDLYSVPESDLVLSFSSYGITGFNGKEEAFNIDFEEYEDKDPDNAIDDPDYEIDDIFTDKDGKQVTFAISGYSNTWVGVIDTEKGELIQCLKAKVMDSVAVGFYDDVLYVCYMSGDPYYDQASVSVMQAVDFSSNEVLKTDIPGDGFYEMLVDDNGILLLSDRLSYVIDHRLNIQSTITGYTDVVCAYGCEGGYVIVDERGRIFCDGIVSGTDKTYEIYGHGDDAMISDAVYIDDDLFIRHTDSNRIVICSPLLPEYEAMDDIGEAEPFDGYSGDEVDLDDLEGIEDISVSGVEVSDDDRYVAVGSNDGTLYIFDRKTGKKQKEIYNTDFAIFHKTFPYLKNADVYIIENRVFDEEFNMISRLPNGEVSAIGKEKKSVVILSPYSLDTYYQVPVISYDDMIKEADRILGDHVPDKDICEKYSIE